MCAGPPTDALPKVIFCCVCTSLQPFRLVVVVFWWWLVVFPPWWCDVLGCYVERCHGVGCDVTWGDVVGCEVTWGEAMWLVAGCHVVSCDVMWSDVKWWNWMGCCVVAMFCGWLWRRVMWSDVVVWFGDLEDDVLWTTRNPWQQNPGEVHSHARWISGMQSAIKPWKTHVKVPRLRTTKCYSVPQCNYDIHVNTWNVQYIAQSNQLMGCKTQWNYDIHVW